MSSAAHGHSALDATADIAETLADLPDQETRVAFLNAGIQLAESQRDIAEDQYTRVCDKADNVQSAWAAKVEEAHAIRVNAGATVDALNSELEALEN